MTEQGKPHKTRKLYRQWAIPMASGEGVERDRFLTEPTPEMMSAAIQAFRPYLDEDGTVPLWDYQEAIRAALIAALQAHPQYAEQFAKEPN